jgi:hypothetical protein
MTILSTQERKYETKTFNGNFAKKVRICRLPFPEMRSLNSLMTEKRQISQGYIIRILQHFATKLRNITNFVMLFQAVMTFLSRLVEIKI